MANETFKKALADKAAELLELIKQEYPSVDYYSVTVGCFDQFGYDSADLFVTAPMGSFEGCEGRLDPVDNFEDDALRIYSIRFNHREAKIV